METRNNGGMRYKSLKTNFDALDSVVTDQMKGIPVPPLEKPYNKEDIVIKLPKADQELAKVTNVFECLGNRRSRRKYTETPITVDELSYLLWFSQGIKRIFHRDNNYTVAMRNVPSAGARHPYETYLVLNNVTGLDNGVYRYLPIEHQLLKIENHNCTEESLMRAINNQEFVVKAPVIFLWAALPYRTEWRYANEAEKLVLIDAGHICQNLYIAAESLELGVCAIAAYVQEEADSLFNLNSEEEFIVYLASVGNYKK